MQIVIIGGVAGGMSAAARMRRIDESANIIVLEAGKYVSFANCGLPYHLGGEIEKRDSLLLHTPESLRVRANLDVRVGNYATAIDRDAKEVEVLADGVTSRISYDKLLIATGASAIVPNIVGADNPAVSTLRTIPELDGVIERADAAIAGAAAAGRAPRATVLGAGFIGLETVEALRGRGFEVDLVDLADHVLPPIDGDLAIYLAAELEANGVRLHLSAAAQEISDAADGGVNVSLSTGESVPADLVVMSVGVRPNSELAAAAGLELGERGTIKVDENMQTSDPSIWAVGDAVEVGFATGRRGAVMLAGPANRQGRSAADAMFGRTVTKQQPVLGTAVVRVFEQVAAVTGAGRRELIAAGIDPIVVRLHAENHAGYYPGAQMMHMLGFFDPETGALLGAQAVGKEGVDKRIDVLATAIRAGMTADDLAELELTYSPPIGSAKDPVNMMGFVAQNHLDGFAPLWQPDNLDAAREQGIILDVRNPGEVKGWKLSDSINVPLPELRDRVSEVVEAAAGKPVFVHCRSGVRSYLATRILRNAGVDARNIAGGELSLKDVGAN